MASRSAVSSASLLLLGTEIPPRDLDCMRLKKAYRRMALLTHPDTRKRRELPDFLHVKEAFEELTRYVQRLETVAARHPGHNGHAAARAAHPSTARSRAQPPPRPKPATAGTTAKGSSSWYWRGRIPARELRLGEYLFYAGIIPWDVLIRAIVEQKGARPSLGQIACRLGLLSRERLLHALERRNRGERIGDALVRLGMMSRATVDQLVAEQKRLQRPLGWHLSRMGCFPISEMPELLGRLWRHNLMAQSRN